MISVACIQMVSTDCPEQNFSRAVSLLEDCLNEKYCELIVFPENFLHFGLKPSSDYCNDVDRYLDYFKEVALSKRVNLVLGSMPVPAGDSKGRFYSRSFLVDSNGELQAYYDKCHLFDVNVDDEHGHYRESDAFCPGKEIMVPYVSFEKEGGVGLGMSICYDLRFSEQYRSMREMGAKIIVVPSAFTEKTGQAHWEILLRARAIETQCFIVAPNQGGLHSKGRTTWGQSMIVDPWGNILAECGQGEGKCIAELDLVELEKIRKNMPVFQ